MLRRGGRSGACRHAPRETRHGTVMDKAAGNGAKLKVLVVEDDEMVREYARAVLTTLGYDPLAVGDGPAALRAIDEDDDICIMLTDIGLPGAMSGPMLAAEVRRRRPG